MADFIVWPYSLLTPVESVFHVMSFSRTGGRTLGGIERTVSTDLGYWQAAVGPFNIDSRAKRRAWQAIAKKLAGRSGIVAMPASVKTSAPFIDDVETTPTLSKHSDGSVFSDGTKYRTRSVDVRMSRPASIGDTAVYLEPINAAPDLVGIRFSYQHALYETGPIISLSGNEWQVPVSPAVRAFIPAGASLECERPTCLMHLSSDDAMQLSENINQFSTPAIGLKEAVEFWDDLVGS